MKKRQALLITSLMLFLNVVLIIVVCLVELSKSFNFALQI
nr:MAG TPA: hypothetical protein [Caudoviricetes sp.]